MPRKQQGPQDPIPDSWVLAGRPDGHRLNTGKYSVEKLTPGRYPLTRGGVARHSAVFSPRFGVIPLMDPRVAVLAARRFA
ncbi:unnamed protein product [Lampetra planeri]